MDTETSESTIRVKQNLTKRWKGKVIRKPIAFIFPLLILLLFGAASAFAEVCHSPFIKYLTTPEKYMYVMAVDADTKDNDFIAVVDVDISSPTYGKIINKLDLGSKGNEPHHMGYTDDRTKI